MNKLVCGVGVNDLDYRTQIKEDVTKNGGRRAQKTVLYANTMQRGKEC